MQTIEAESTVEVLPEHGKLQIVVQESGLAPMAAQPIYAAFSPLAKDIHALVTKAKGETDIKLARAFRLALKKSRGQVEETRKAQKQNYLLVGRVIDGMAAALELVISPVEKEMEAIEKAEEIKAKAAQQALKAERVALLTPYGVDTMFYQLDVMPEANFQMLLENTIAADNSKKEAAAKAEMERIEAENARLKEDARIREENDRLQRESQERKAEDQRQEALRRAAAERKLQIVLHYQQRGQITARGGLLWCGEEAVYPEHADAVAESNGFTCTENMIAALEQAQAAAEAEAAAKKERDAAEALRVAAQQKADAEKARAEARAQAEVLAANAKLADEQEKRQKLEADNKARFAAEKKEAARLAEMARKAERAPDKEKFLVLAQSFKMLPLPTVASVDGQRGLKLIITARDNFANSIVDYANTL